MTKNYQARLIFPSIFHEYTFKKKYFKQKELIDFCYEQKKLHPNTIYRSNRGGLHSPDYHINEENPISIHLRNVIGQSVFTTLKQDLKVNITYWIMINSPNSYNTLHTHPNSHISGVFWIKASNNSGELKFINPNCFEKHAEINCYVEKFKLDTNVYESFKYSPIEGKMITFPSHVLHEVANNESKEDRIAVSYNISLLGW